MRVSGASAPSPPPTLASSRRGHDRVAGAALRWGWGLAAWTVLGVFFATQTFVGAAYGGRPLTWGQASTVALVAWYIRGAFAPAEFALARRFSLARGRRVPRIAILAAAGLVCAVAQQMLYEGSLRTLTWIPRRAAPPIEFHTNLLTFWVVIGIAHGVEYYRRYRDRELAASRLAAQLSAARLELLRAQLHPHFLFNTLHAISELMHEDVERADLMVAQLSELLRLSLQRGAAPEVSLREELSLLDRYLAIERVRFADRLEVTLHADPTLLDARVPHLILQPIVENAVRHGVARRDGGRIDVRAERARSGGRAAGEAIRLTVSDDGPGCAATQHGGELARDGIGLANTRERLREHYGDRQRLEVSPRLGGGTVVMLEIPLAGGADAAAVVET